MMHPRPANTSVRHPAVAGLFYPADPIELRGIVSAYLRHAAPAQPGPRAKALIVPHAGYIYSGSVAAAGYAALAGGRGRIKRVVLIGPSHRVYLRGMAVPLADTFVTPLGVIGIDRELKESLLRRPDVVASDTAHAMEHCLEVQLPFLQVLLEGFSLLPLVLGAASAGQVGEVLAELWGGEETLVLVSSDLSHYHRYDVANRIDAATSSAILQYTTTLGGDQACGAVGINGLMCLARERGMSVHEIARCNSGDTGGRVGRRCAAW